MKNRHIILLMSSLFFTSACNYSIENHDKKHSQIANIAAHHEDEDIINLNGKNKWQIPDHMLKNISSMEEEINNFSGETQEDYLLLSLHLEENIEELKNGCTMTGRAHNELHKWLHPFIQKSQKLSAAPDAEKSALILTDLKKAFTEFHVYFE